MAVLHDFWNSGLTSMVLCTWFFNAAQRSAVVLPAPFPVLAICAKFALNLSLSIFSSFSFRFMAPGLLLRLFKFFRRTVACPTSSSSFPPSSSKSGRALAIDSRLATSFLFGRLRFVDFADDFSILPTNEECLIERLSRLDEAKSEEDSISGAGGCGRELRADLARAVVRFLLVTGAFPLSEIDSPKAGSTSSYHF